MKLKITIDEKDSFNTHTDYNKYRLWQVLSALHDPHPSNWKQKVEFETEKGEAITIRMSFPQVKEFWVFLVNNV